MNLLFVGNSITKHGKCSYWPGVWGMAASSAEKDYVHLLVDKLRKSGQHVEYADINFFKWEIMDHDRDEVLPLLDDLLDKSYDYIIVQLGENISSVANLEGDLRSLLTYLQKSCLKENVLVCSSFFQKDDIDNIKRNICSRGGEQYVSFEDIRCIAPYIAGDNIEIKLDNKIFHINHAGVAIHPGDRGMEIYAERLFNCIKKKGNIDCNMKNDVDGITNKKFLFKEKYAAWIQRNKNEIKKLVFLQKYEEALANITTLANSLYESNQYYVDNDLENALLNIQKQLQKKYDFGEIKEVNDKTVLFYDGFGLDSRGLAYIYIKALVNLGYKIIYMTIPNAQGNIPRITKLIEEAGGEIVFCRTNSYTLWYQYIYKVFSIVKPAKAFFYTTPHDVSAVMAFNQLTSQVERYQINLTDHAFWLGINAFDYCLEFRDYGAALSQQYRNINPDKQLLQPFYPDVNTKVEFQGFPFRKSKDDYVVFSGGALYKTMDDNFIYYQIIEYLLLKYPQIKFWYAGFGSENECKSIKDLILKYPGRVFHTPERKDLFQVMQNIDMYISTYPLGGGLMSQYSAIAGKAPLTFSTSGPGAVETLLGYENFKLLTADIDDFINMLDNYMNTKQYSEKMYCEKLKASVITEKQFEANLNNILANNISGYKFKSIRLEERLNDDKSMAWCRFSKKYAKNY